MCHGKKRQKLLKKIANHNFEDFISPMNSPENRYRKGVQKTHFLMFDFFGWDFCDSRGGPKRHRENGTFFRYSYIFSLFEVTRTNDSRATTSSIQDFNAASRKSTTDLVELSLADGFPRTLDGLLEL